MSPASSRRSRIMTSLVGKAEKTGRRVSTCKTTGVRGWSGARKRVSEAAGKRRRSQLLDLAARATLSLTEAFALAEA
jgi:hypothetical protein